ncbi:MAG: hypothetical protein EOP17_21140 [Rhizobiaceae bacterium]|nr:MAG: hypothetical protein EOP17_21140 [Rhizobiaceae bacterium]
MTREIHSYANPEGLPPGFKCSLPVIIVLPALANFQAIVAGTSGRIHGPERSRIFKIEGIGNGSYYRNADRSRRPHIR